MVSWTFQKYIFWLKSVFSSHILTMHKIKSQNNVFNNDNSIKTFGYKFNIPIDGINKLFIQ